MKNEIVYLAESSAQKAMTYLWDIIEIAIVIYCFFQFKENPLVISIVILIVSFVFIISGYNRVILYNNAVSFEVKHMINPLSKKWQYKIENIQSIEADLQLTKRQFFLFEVFSSWIPSYIVWNTITIELNDGTKKIISTKVYKSELLKIFQLLNKLSDNRIVITSR